MHFVETFAFLRFCVDMIDIDKTDEHFRLLYDVKGRFVLHRVTKAEAAVRATGVSASLTAATKPSATPPAPSQSTVRPAVMVSTLTLVCCRFCARSTSSAA